MFFHEETTIAADQEAAHRFCLQLTYHWYARLVNAFAAEVGVYYGGEKKVLPLTVTTYHSAGDYAIYIGFVRSQQLQRSHGPGWLLELMRLSSSDAQARRAVLARQRLLQLLGRCEGKFTPPDASTFWSDFKPGSTG